jgi:gluconokinase
MIVVLFGVAGSGKTTIGHLLAEELGWNFYDADEFHPASNLEKMGQGIALTDADRWPWLETLRELLKERIARKENLILACSALKEEYRDYLQISDEIKWIFLKGEYGLVADRFEQRRGHFMNSDLLRSQFETLEEPKRDALVVDVDATPERIVQIIRRQLQV